MFASLPLLPILAQVQAEAAMTTDRWSELFFGLDQNQRFVLMIIAIGCATGVICTVIGCTSSMTSTMHRRRMEHELKQDLLDRGMTAEEVARVVESTTPHDFLDRIAASYGKKKHR